MANKLYGSTGGLSNEVTKMYASVGGLSDNIVKGYCSVGGLSKLFFGNGEAPYEDLFWFYYSTISGKIIDYSMEILPPLGGQPTYVPHTVTKDNIGIAFYCITGHLQNRIRYLFTFSIDQSAISITDSPSVSSSTGSVTIDDDTWYYRYENISGFAAEVSPSCCIINSDFQNMTPQQIITWVINNRIYVDDFAEDYQVGQRYNLVKADMEKTIRKFLAVYLYKMIPYKSPYSTAYNSILTNVENIVAYFIQHSGNNDIIDLWADYNDSSGLRLGAYYSNDSVNNVLVESIDTTDNGGYNAVETDAYISYNSCVYIDFNGGGTVTYNTPSWSTEDSLYIGKGGYGWDYLHWSNVGLKFAGTKDKYKKAYHNPDEYMQNEFAIPVSVINDSVLAYNFYLSDGSSITSYTSTGTKSIISSSGVVYCAILFRQASIADPTEKEYIAIFISDKTFTCRNQWYNSQTEKTTTQTTNASAIEKSGTNETYYYSSIYLGYTHGGSSWRNRYKSSSIDINKCSEMYASFNTKSLWVLGHIIFTGSIS